LAAAGVLLLGLASAGQAAGRGGGSVVGTKHDLAWEADGLSLCDFCHISHTAATTGPLWNRPDTVGPYRPYASATLDARPGQPDGVSKLCLSCHDGTVAIDSVRRRPRGSGQATTQRRIERGTPGHVGTDLSDDHPISIVYDARLASRDEHLTPPEHASSGLGGTVQRDLLDLNSKVQCTSCHDPHDDSINPFLLLPASDGTLCVTCHQRVDYALSVHAPGKSPQLSGNCLTCHKDHGAEPGTTLLTYPLTELCVRCHDGHRLGAHVAEGYLSDRRRHVDGRLAEPVTCATCHEPHTVRANNGVRREVLTDPDHHEGRRLVDPELVPHSYSREPTRAAADAPDFCLDCHDGSWPGATVITTELLTADAVETEFNIGHRNLHSGHAKYAGRGRVGCTYCHDPHGSAGNGGIPRSKSLYGWLSVNEFPYRRKASCSTGDIGGRCHGR
jgi:predicted CXXCH cytochrome family protein